MLGIAYEGSGRNMGKQAGDYGDSDKTAASEMKPAALLGYILKVEPRDLLAD